MEKSADRQHSTLNGNDEAKPDLTVRLRQYWWRTVNKPAPVTFEGVMFILLAVLIGLAATNTGTNLLYLVFSLMLAFLLVSGVISMRSLKRLGVQRGMAKHIVAGESVDVRLTISNHKLMFSAYGLQVSDRMQDGKLAGHCYFLRVPPRDKATVSFPCVFNRRGLYHFRDVVISTTYPFGFIRRALVLPAARDVLVYPQILPWKEIALEIPRDFGERETPRKGNGVSLYGIREPLPQEDSRWIHWKKTAQVGRLMLREFEAEEGKSILIVLDNALSDAIDPREREAFERAVVLAASMAHHLLEAEQQVELLTRSGRVPGSTGPQQRHRILRALATVEPVSAGGRPMRIGARADMATIVFRCNGHNGSDSFPNGTRVFVVSAPGEPAVTPASERSAEVPAP